MSLRNGLAVVLAAVAVAGLSRGVHAQEVADPVAEATVAVVAEPLPAQYEWLRRAKPESVVCPFRGRIKYEPGEIECGLIQVPENREVQGSRSIELHYVRMLAKGKDAEGNAVSKRSDPVVYLSGGPGAGIEGYVRRFKDHGLLEQRDLYLLEQRGIGSSTTFCPFFSSRNRDAQAQESFEGHQRSRVENAHRCLEVASSQGVDLRGYNTFENARDVRALRLALGFERWNVWGISYGSVLAQALIKEDPDGILAVVIDGIVPLDIGDLMRIGRWYARDLDQLFAACEQQPACKSAYPDQKRRYLAAIESVMKQPFAFDVTPDERFPTGKAYLHAEIVAGLPFSLMYEQSTHAAVPAIIEGLIKAVEARDQNFFRALALLDLEGMQSGGYGAGMAQAIHCQDGYVDGSVRVAAEEVTENPVLGRVFGNPEASAQMASVCAGAGIPGRDLAQYAPLVSDLPILVANGAWDPVTPTPLAHYIMPGLSRGQLVEFPHAGHGPTRSLKCAGKLLNAFYNDPAAPLDSECVKDGEQAASYVAPYYASSALSRAALLYAEDRKQLLPHALWVGLPLFVLLVGGLVLVVGGLARRFNRARPVPGATARWITGLAAWTGVLHAAGLGVAGALSGKLTPALLLFGMVGWASWAAWLGPVSGVLGLIALLLALGGSGLNRSARLGCMLVALAALALAWFGWHWDLWPF